MCMIPGYVGGCVVECWVLEQEVNGLNTIYHAVSTRKLQKIS